MSVAVLKLSESCRLPDVNQLQVMGCIGLWLGDGVVIFCSLTTSLVA